MLEAYAESDVGRFTVTLKSSVAIGLVAAGDVLQFLAADGTLADGQVTAVDAASRRFVVRYDAAQLAAPETNEPEVRLAVGTEIIRLAGNDVEAVANVERLQRYRYRLETAGDSVRSLGVKPGDTVRFMATSGDRFTAAIDGLYGEDVVIRYSADRADRPDLVHPEIALSRPAALSAQWTAGLGALADEAYAATHVATVQDLLVELGGLQGLPLADAVSVLQLDAATGVLTLTHALAPQPLEFVTPLDLSPQIDGLTVSAAGQITATLAPQLRVPLVVGLRELRNDGAAWETKLAIKEDAAAELQLQLTAGQNDPRAAATLGFLSLIVEENATVPNAGFAIGAAFTANVVDNQPGAADDGRMTLAEIAALPNPADFTQTTTRGYLDIDGLVVRATGDLASLGETNVSILGGPPAPSARRCRACSKAARACARCRSGSASAATTASATWPTCGRRTCC